MGAGKGVPESGGGDQRRDDESSWDEWIAKERKEFVAQFIANNCPDMKCEECEHVRLDHYLYDQFPEYLSPNFNMADPKRSKCGFFSQCKCREFVPEPEYVKKIEKIYEQVVVKKAMEMLGK